MNDLQNAEVNERISSYSKEGVTEKLYSFGKMLLGESVDRINRIESKATAVAGYSGAILAFLLSGLATWLRGMAFWQQVLVLCAGVFSFLAVAAALSALLIWKYKWFSDAQWFENEDGILEDPDRLQRYYVLAMHGIVKKLGRTNDMKANRVMLAQFALGLAGLCLAIVFCGQLLRGL